MLKRITDSKFHALVIYPGAYPLAEEKEWWANNDETILGTVLLDLVDKDWSLVILGRDERGTFRAFDLDVSIDDRDTARRTLLQKMIKHEASGATVFPQGD